MYHLSVLNSEPRHIFLERSFGFNSPGAIKSASIQCRRTSPCHPKKCIRRNIFLLPKTAQSQFDGVAVSGPKLNPAKAMRGSEVKYGRYSIRRLSSTPSWERATHFSTTQQTQSSISTTEILLVRMIFCGHNIEFSCPAASGQHCMELPDCIQRSIRPFRGQLQRFVMTTIRVMACTERASLNALATKATESITFRFSTASLATSSWKGALASTAEAQSSLRASNAGGLPHAITEKCIR